MRVTSAEAAYLGSPYGGRNRLREEPWPATRPHARPTGARLRL